MKTLQTQENLDDLAVEAVRLGRQLAERARALNLGGTARQAAFVTRCLIRLNERQPFSEADEGGLNAVREIFGHDIASEVIDIDERFVETHFDEFGQQGEVRKMPVYSPRGAELITLERLFADFLVKRHAVLDHVSAHRELLKIMTG